MYNLISFDICTYLWNHHHHQDREHIHHSPQIGFLCLFNCPPLHQKDNKGISCLLLLETPLGSLSKKNLHRALVGGEEEESLWNTPRAFPITKPFPLEQKTFPEPYPSWGRAFLPLPLDFVTQRGEKLYSLRNLRRSHSETQASSKAEITHKIYRILLPPPHLTTTPRQFWCRARHTTSY